MKKLRIAQITNLWESVPPKGKGGLEQLVHYLTEELVKRGYEVTLFATADSQTSARLFPVWPTAVSRDRTSQIRKIGWYSDLSVASAFLRADEFDIIHDHTYFVGGRYGGLLKTPVVLTMHHPVSFEQGLREEFPQDYQQYLARAEEEQFAKTTIVTVSEFQKTKLEEVFGRKAIAIHNGLPMQEWNTYTPEPGSYFAFLGYMSGNKGAKEAIQAILKTDEKLIIAGGIEEHDTPSWDYFKAHVEPFIDNNKIKYLGKIDHAQKQELLKNAKATLMPIQWDEPFGLVAIESLACGTPVIGMNRGALPEIIADGQTGFLVNTIKEMTAAIKTSSKLSREMARKSVLDRFTVEKMVDEYEKLYNDLSK